jgi:preprotein translocase subunit SecA
MLSREPVNKPLPKGLDGLWDRAGGMCKRFSRRTGRYLRRADRVLAREEHCKDLADVRLRERLEDFRQRYRRGRDTPEDLIEAYALLREAAFRTTGLKPFGVQVAGALALADGCIAEMATGEGKTLTATLPATVAGWRGQGLHLVTANDYLAARDAESMSPMYTFCGLRAAAVTGDMQPADRRDAYQADITYTTNKEAAADFLRDRLSLGRMKSLPEALLAKIARGRGSGTDRLVQRGLCHALVDEVDSILIDEAVTPLIISGQAPNSQQAETFQQAADLAAEFHPGRDYRVNARYREVTLTSAGRQKLDELTVEHGGIWAGRRRSEELLVQALTAREFYRLDKQYVIQEDKVVIVDEFTGRLMPDREWRDGLHQAVSAKEGLDVEAPKDTFARLSFQRFFRMYRNLAGMTGTAAEARAEFWQIYHLPVVVVPTNRPCIRKIRPEKVFATEDAKWSAIVSDIRARHQRGQPVLVGTRSVGASEHLGQLLAKAGMDCQVLNAVRHREEAEIVARAGQEGNITVATNMAGRGTDIKLARGITEKGGLHVIMSERHEAKRVDRQLIGRCARQGDPGSAQAFVSLEDELVLRHAPHLSALLRSRYKRREKPIYSPTARELFDIAQEKAQKQALNQRKGVLKSDDWLEEYLGFAGREL